MPDTHVDNLKVSVSGTPGTGTATIGSAASGCRGFVAGDDGKTFSGRWTDGTAWETASGCRYTHSGTTLARGTLLASSTGSRISLTSAAVFECSPVADLGNRLEAALQSAVPGGRLTLESGVPISTTDQTAKTTIYYTPFVHNIINLWDGANWKPTTFAETSLALGTLTSGKPYDVFSYLSGGALALESLAWTSDTARATAVTLQDGRYCKSGDKTRLLLGTFYTTATTTTEDSIAQRFLSNIYNQVSRQIRVSSTSAHSYNGGYRYWNNSSANRIQLVISNPAGQTVPVGCSGEGAATAGRYVITAQKLDGNTSYDGVPAYFLGASGGSAGAVVHAVPTGYHYIAAVESSASLGAADFNTMYLGGTLLA